MAASGTFPSAGTYVYSVTPTGASSGTPVTVTINVVAAVTPPPTGGTDVALCTAYPGGYQNLLNYTFPAGALANVTNFNTLLGNSAGYAPATTMRMYWGAPIFAVHNGIMQINESPNFAAQGVYKWVSISERPCDFNTGSGGTAKWLAKETAIRIEFTVEAQEGYILKYPWSTTIRSGIRLQAGKTYYLNVINAAYGDNQLAPSCSPGTNCGIVIDIFQPN